MRRPPLPQPLAYYDQQWAARLVTDIERFMQALALGNLEVGGKLITTSARIVGVTLVTSTPYTILLTDDVVDVNVAAPVALTLPANPLTGQTLLVQDASGNASGDNITISGSVNGAASVVISTDYGRLLLIYNGTEWIAA